MAKPDKYITFKFNTTVLDVKENNDGFTVITEAGEYSTRARNNDVRETVKSHIGKMVKLAVRIKIDTHIAYFHYTEVI